MQAGPNISSQENIPLLRPFIFRPNLKQIWGMAQGGCNEDGYPNNHTHTLTHTTHTHTHTRTHKRTHTHTHTHTQRDTRQKANHKEGRGNTIDCGRIPEKQLEPYLTLIRCQG